MHFKVFSRKQNFQNKPGPYISAIIIRSQIDSRMMILLSLGTNWLPSLLLRYKNCSLWFLSFRAIIFNTDQFGRLFSGNEIKNLLGTEIKTHLIMPVAFALIFLRQFKAWFLCTWSLKLGYLIPYLLVFTNKFINS